MNDEFVKNVSVYGEKGKEWLQEIPNVIAQYEKLWSLRVLAPYKLSYNYVAPVIQNDGTKAVIKIGMPWEEEFRNEIKALQLFNGDGVTKLLKVDEDEFVILIEQIQPGTPLSTLQDDDKATRILASLMKKLWKPLPSNHSFITFNDWTRELRAYPQNPTDNVPLALAEEGIALFDYLLSTSQPAVLTHGDLHHDNVLSLGKDSWLTIDPKGIAAEPLYDVAALIRNPYEKIRNTSPEGLVKLFKRRISILAEELEADPKRIQQWCLAQTILSAVWTQDNPEHTEHALRVIHALKKIE